MLTTAVSDDDVENKLWPLHGEYRVKKVKSRHDLPRHSLSESANISAALGLRVRAAAAGDISF